MPAPKPTPGTGEPGPNFRTAALIALGTLLATAVVAGIAYYAGMNR